jgi:hypothetical protein
MIMLPGSFVYVGPEQAENPLPVSIVGYPLGADTCLDRLARIQARQ